MANPVYKEFMSEYSEASALVKWANRLVRGGKMDEATVVLRRAERAMPSETLLRQAKEAAPLRMAWRVSTYGYNREVHLEKLTPVRELRRLKRELAEAATGTGHVQ